jgi:mRNA-degrading endonuclease toxin of MazEF toxin-antitoxin module
MSYENKKNSREAWLRRLQVYWDSPTSPHFITRVGEIYEVDFGMNPGTEFSGRHLAICLRDSVPSQEKMLVVPLTTKFKEYNIAEEDIVETISLNGKNIKAGVVLGEATWVSKFRVFECSKILEENPDTSKLVKGFIDITKSNLKRWSTL